MKRFENCKCCGKYINSNISMCGDCWDIKIYGSKENARKAAIENFKTIGINVK